jgi:hypothetical protein
MPRKRLTLVDLVEGRTFDAGNHRHRRALDESGPLAGPVLEAARRHVLDLAAPGTRAYVPLKPCENLPSS